MIVATAGHVNHGKTALVAALTGIDTDRLPEEKRRGLTIDLGFAHHALPDGRIASFVDVPGHERFVRNMLAGVTAIDAALFVVAADDGPKPQTLEHLAILDLLGVSHGLVALTKADRVPPERLEEVEGAIATILADTSLAGVHVVPVSSLTGAGIPALREALSALAAGIAARPAAGHFRLAIDRAFLVQGTGLVVTGSVFSGRVATGDRLLLSPPGTEVRVRGIHADNQTAENAVAGQRCALNLAGTGVRKQDIRRGDWVLAEGAHAPTARIDARIRVLAGEARALAHWTPAHLHLGAADTTCRIAVLGAKAIPPGGDCLAQLVLDRPLGALYGDRLILRDQAARRTIAGGHVVDPFPPRRGRARPERLGRLTALEQPDAQACLQSLLDLDSGGLDLDGFARARNLEAAEAEALWSRVPMVRIPGAEPATGFSPESWAALRARVVEALADWHARTPEAMGPGEDEVRPPSANCSMRVRCRGGVRSCTCPATRRASARRTPSSGTGCGPRSPRAGSIRRWSGTWRRPWESSRRRSNPSSSAPRARGTSSASRATASTCPPPSPPSPPWSKRSRPSRPTASSRRPPTATARASGATSPSTSSNISTGWA